MESYSVLGSFHDSVFGVSPAHGSLERPGSVRFYSGSWPASRRSCFPGLIFGEENHFSRKQNVTLISCVKTPEATVTAKSNVQSDRTKKGSSEKKTSRTATFPNEFEIGDFKMHLKRNVGATKAPLSNISPTTAPPIPTKPMNKSAAATPSPSPPKPFPEKVSPFKNTDFEKSSSKLAALEASGSNNYVFVPSPIVRTFRRGRR